MTNTKKSKVVLIDNKQRDAFVGEVTGYTDEGARVCLKDNNHVFVPYSSILYIQY